MTNRIAIFVNPQAGDPLLERLKRDGYAVRVLEGDVAESLPKGLEEAGKNLAAQDEFVLVTAGAGDYSQLTEQACIGSQKCLNEEDFAAAWAKLPPAKTAVIMTQPFAPEWQETIQKRDETTFVALSLKEKRDRELFEGALTTSEDHLPFKERLNQAVRSGALKRVIAQALFPVEADAELADDTKIEKKEGRAEFDEKDKATFDAIMKKIENFLREGSLEAIPDLPVFPKEKLLSPQGRQRLRLSADLLVSKVLWLFEQAIQNGKELSPKIAAALPFLRRIDVTRLSEANRFLLTVLLLSQEVAFLKEERLADIQATREKLETMSKKSPIALASIINAMRMSVELREALYYLKPALGAWKMGHWKETVRDAEAAQKILEEMSASPDTLQKKAVEKISGEVEGLMAKVQKLKDLTTAHRVREALHFMEEEGMFAFKDSKNLDEAIAKMVQKHKNIGSFKITDVKMLGGGLINLSWVIEPHCPISHHALGNGKNIEESTTLDYFEDYLTESKENRHDEDELKNVCKEPENLPFAKVYGMSEGYQFLKGHSGRNLLKFELGNSWQEYGRHGRFEGDHYRLEPWEFFALGFTPSLQRLDVGGGWSVKDSFFGGRVYEGLVYERGSFKGTGRRGQNVLRFEVGGQMSAYPFAAFDYFKALEVGFDIRLTPFLGLSIEDGFHDVHWVPLYGSAGLFSGFEF